MSPKHLRPINAPRTSQTKKLRVRPTLSCDFCSFGYPAVPQPIKVEHPTVSQQKTKRRKVA